MVFLFEPVTINRPVKSISQIFKIAVVDEDRSPEEEADTLKNVTTIIADEFSDINKTIIKSC